MYNTTKIIERIRFTAKRSGLLIGDVMENAGLSKSTLTNFRTSMPKADNLAKIADALDCSVDYLLGRTDKSEVNH